MFHNDTHTGNILYKNIEKGGYLKYIINGKEIFIKNLGYLIILWDFAGAIINIDPMSNHTIVPHKGEKIYYTHDYVRIVEEFSTDMKHFSNKTKNNIRNINKNIEHYKNISEKSLWDNLLMTLFPIHNVSSTDYIFSETIINIPIINRPELKQRNDNFDLQKINSKLLKKLEIARSNIHSREDLFLDEEHKRMCEVYQKWRAQEGKTDHSPETQKYLDLYHRILEDKKKNIISKDLIVKFKNYRFGKNNIKDIFSEDMIYHPVTHTFDLEYNKYNKKFFNTLNYNFNGNVITNFINKQNKFIGTMSLREKLLLREYIDAGIFASIIHLFQDGNLGLKKIIDTIIDFGSFKYKDMDGNILFPDEKIAPPPFIMQTYTVLKKHRSPLVENDISIQELAEKFYNIDVLKNINYNQWKEILDLYMKELSQLLDKAPKTDEEIVLYRGVQLDYIGPSSKKGFFTLNRFASTSLDSDRAFMYSYMEVEEPILYRITIAKGIPLLFIEPFNQIEEDIAEVLIPKGCIIYIDKGLKKIDTFNQDEDICPKKREIDGTGSVLDMKVVAYNPPT